MSRAPAVPSPATPPAAGVPTASPPRTPVPWWVLPAIVLSGLVGALMARWMEGPPPPVAQAPAIGVEGSAQARATLPSPLPSAPPMSPPDAKTPPAGAVPAPLSGAIELSGMLMVAGQPAMALVGVGGAPAVLVRPGDRITATAVVVSIEASAMQVRDGGRVSRIEVSSAPSRIAAAPLRPVATAPADAMPAPAAGVAPAPAEDAPGSGNAAFRAAIEDKVRAMGR